MRASAHRRWQAPAPGQRNASRESRIYGDFRPTGWVADRAGHELGPDAWTTLHNVAMRLGAAERGAGHGYALEGLGPVDPYGVVYVDDAPASYWLAVGPSELFAHDGTQWHNVKGTFASAATWALSADILNGVPVINGPDATPHYWGKSTAAGAAELPGWLGATTYAGVIRAHRSHLFALGLEVASADFGQRIAWSDAAPAGSVPGTWVPSPTNEAGDMDLAGSGVRILDGASLRDSLIVYSDREAWEVFPAGGNFIYGQRKLYADTGIMGKGCVLGLSDRHICLSDGDLIEHAGGEVRSLLHGRARRWLERELSSDSPATPHLELDKAADLVWLVYPGRGEDVNSACLFYDMHAGELGVKEFTPKVRRVAYGKLNEITGDIGDWDSDAQAWDLDGSPWDPDEVGDPVMLGVEPGAKFQEYRAGVGDGATALEAFAERDGMTLGEPGRIKHVSHVRPVVQADAGVTFYVRTGAQRTRGAAVEWGSERVWISGEDDEIYAPASGEYIAVRVRSLGDAAWRLEGVDLRFQLAGRD